MTKTIEGAVVAKDKPKHGDKLKRYRIIIRNLPFSCTETALRNTCAKFGPLTEVKLVSDKDTKKFRGFAFVQYKSPSDAAKAISKLNGKELLGRKITVDWTVAKAVYDTIKSGATPPSASATSKGLDHEGESGSSSGSSDDDSSDSDDDVDDTEASGAKTDTKMATDTSTGATSDAESDVGSSDTDSKSVDDDDKESRDGESSDAGNDTESDNSDADEDEDFEKSSDVQQGCTVFVRNVSFDTTEESLKETFSQFGDVALCKVVEDIGTGRSRGMAFVSFPSGGRE